MPLLADLLPLYHRKNWVCIVERLSIQSRNAILSPRFESTRRKNSENVRRKMSTESEAYAQSVVGEDRPPLQLAQRTTTGGSPRGDESFYTPRKRYMNFLSISETQKGVFR